MIRRRLILCLLALAALSPACEVGEKIDLGSGGGTGGVAIVVRQTSSTTPTKGQPVPLEATVTEDGSPKSATVVTWSVSPDDGTLTFNSNTSNTNSQGIATATLNTTANSPGSITITAAGAGQTGTLALILQ